MPTRCHVAVVSPELWHSRLGHPAPAARDGNGYPKPEYPTGFTR
jgi:hypothetical protein